MSVSMNLDHFILLWLELPLSPMAGLLVEILLHSNGLCTLQFPRNFPPVSLLHQYHTVSFQVLILDSLSLVLMFSLIRVGFYLESSPYVLLVLDSFML